MDTENSVTIWMAQLKAGDADSAQKKLWDRYFKRLVGLARQKMQGVPPRAADPEDVALSALNSFFGGVEQSRFPRLDDRDNLWALLSQITAWKAINERRRHLAKKRGGGQVRGELSLGPAEDGADFLSAVADDELSPDLLVAMSERCRLLLDDLNDQILHTIAERKLAGHTNNEIAAELDVVERTVERKLGKIRDRWAKELEVN